MILPNDLWRHIFDFVPRDSAASSPVAAVFREGVRTEGRSTDGLHSLLLVGRCPVCSVVCLPSRYILTEGRSIRDPCCTTCFLEILAHRMRSASEERRRQQEQSRWVAAYLPRLYPWQGWV